VFASALGLGSDDAGFLREVLLRAAVERECVPGEKDEFGQRYTLDFELESAGGRERVRSGWIVRQNENFPRLTTCYIVLSKRKTR
jgi:hypothetical protein